MYVMPVESIFLEGKGLRMLKFGKNILQASRHINNLQNNMAVQLSLNNSQKAKKSGDLLCYLIDIQYL